MTVPKVAIVYHHIALYRRAVFEELCQSEAIDFVFYADNRTHQDSLALVTAKEAGGTASGLLAQRMIQTENLWILKRLLWQGRVVKDVFADRYDAYIFLGSIHYLSTWMAALTARLRGRPVEEAKTLAQRLMYSCGMCMEAESFINAPGPP